MAARISPPALNAPVSSLSRFIASHGALSLPDPAHRTRRAAARVALLTALLAPHRAHAAPAEDAALTLTQADLGPVYNVANVLSNRPPCPVGSVDLAAVGTFARAASLLDVAARHYPPRTSPRSDPAIHARKRLVLVDEAVQLYEQAYACAPGSRQRHHLERALDLLDAARQLTVDIDHLPPDAPELAVLAARRSSIAARITPPKPPPTQDVDLPPRRKRAPTPETRPARERGRFVLRPELGFGFGHLTNQGVTPEKSEQGYIGSIRRTSNYKGIYAGLVAAARFPLGVRAVHAFVLGGALGVQQVAPLPDFENDKVGRHILQGGLHLEFALHAHPRWFSFHPLLDFGAQLYVGGKKFGRPYVAPGLGLCLDREVVCLTARFSVPFALPGNPDAKIYQGQFGLAVDLMRIAERRRG